MKNNVVSQAKRLDFLESKHRDLHSRIESLEAEKAPEKFITSMKKEKLKIKDEIENLRRFITANTA